MRITLLPYSGGKKPMYKKYIKPILEILHENGYKIMISPFLGGGYSEFNWILDYNDTKLISSDINKDLIDFYKYVFKNPNKFYKNLLNESKKITSKTTLLEIKNNVKNKYVRFYLVYKLSFQSFISANSRISNVKYKQFKNMLKSEKLKYLLKDLSEQGSVSVANARIKFKNKDFSEIFVSSSKKMRRGERSAFDTTGDLFYFFDPPYFFDIKDKYEKYGLKNLYYQGHKQFEHNNLYNYIKNLKVPFILFYNNHPYIRNMYKNYNIKKIVFRGKEEIIITNF